MKKEDLIRKWLDFDLTEDELEAFKKLDTSNSHLKISEAVQYFKAPAFDATSNYQILKEQLSEKKKEKVTWLRYVGSIAAIFAIGVMVYFAVFLSPTKTFYAENKESKNLSLPDASEVFLNSGSSLSYSKDEWKHNRLLKLEGEAYFKVAKGKKFTVQSAHGNVTVLGTEFNVKDREAFFEVTCYEGLVAVTINNKEYQLAAGNSLKFINNKMVRESISLLLPSWIAHKSTFKSIPLQQVLDEMQRQYDIQIMTPGIDTTILFTGSFTHNNLDTALKSITIPLKLVYNIEKDVVTLKK